ncbi:T9SS C-terminal target domain-containing protein, partial [bacterium]
YFEMRDWHYGLIFIGDPTLKIGRFMDKPGPNFCYALLPGRNDTITTATPVFQWTETDSADHYNLIITGGLTEWTSENLQTTSYQIPEDVLESGKRYSWSVKAYKGLDCIDFSQPREITYVFQTSMRESFSENAGLPKDLTILGNYPNPFNTSTTISFIVPDKQSITITLYNALGQEVKKLLDHEMLNGNQNVSWNGTDYSERLVPSGLYFCRISDGNTTKIKKMLFIQ